MSGGSSSEQKTENATPKKLRDAKEKGQVMKSTEVVSASLLVTLLVYLFLGESYFLHQLGELTVATNIIYEAEFKEALEILFWKSFWVSAVILVPMGIIIIIIGSLSNILQSGFVFSFEPLKPELNKINPVEGVKKIFSIKNLVELIKSMIKVGVLSLALYLVIDHHIPQLVSLPHCGTACLFPYMVEVMKVFGMVTAIAFIIIAFLDFFFQKWEFLRSMRMTKYEVKKEHKDMEGDPQIKGKRKQTHRELVMGGMEQAVRQSSAVVINPTHLAVGIYYKNDLTALPRVTFKERGSMARMVIHFAKQYDIPIYRDIPLAHALTADGEVDRAIPADMIEAIAVVIQWVRAQQANNWE